MVEIEKLKELDYNELVLLNLIEQNSDLKNIFVDVIKVPFSVLYKLSKEDKLNDATKETLSIIFNKIVLTNDIFIDKYQRIMYEGAEESDKIDEVKIPRRYGKNMILKDIELQGGNATSLQRAMLKVNDLKNLYVILAEKGKKNMLNLSNTLDDEDCRKISAAITTFERQMAAILKKNKNK